MINKELIDELNADLNEKAVDGKLSDWDSGYANLIFASAERLDMIERIDTIMEIAKIVSKYNVDVAINGLRRLPYYYYDTGIEALNNHISEVQ